MSTTTMDSSSSKLLELVHQYYPANLRGDEDAYVQSEQYQRLLKARRDALENSGPWKGLLSRLREALPECSVEDWSMLFSEDNCWRVRVYLPGAVQFSEIGREHRAVVCLVSILAPVYVLYTSFHKRVGLRSMKPALFYEQVPETKSYADKVEELVCSELDARPLPHETLFMPVPDIQCGNVSLGKARLIDCLFTDNRW